jgi:hypothetical protein
MPVGLQGLVNLDSNGNLNVNIDQVSGSFKSVFTRVTANMNLNLNSIFKPQGNQRGDSTSSGPDGKNYPKGFTPPVDSYVNPGNLGLSGYPVEYGYSMIRNGALVNSQGKLSKTNGLGFADPNNFRILSAQPYGVDRSINSNSATVNSQYERRNQRYKAYESFGDLSSKQFTHLLDYYMDSSGVPSVDRLPNLSEISNPDSLKGIYLGSFIRTTDDNEDPTTLAYDIEIKRDTSPLFNGEIDRFISLIGGLGNSEVSSRSGILEKFKAQIIRFLKVDAAKTEGSPSFLVNSTTGEEMSNSGVKTYYLKNLAGLDNLNEQNNSNSQKSFVKYGEDFLTLGFYEDVSQNIGYLSSLYKSLSWSRINGKQIIPENILRFDIDITITEMRKYNRVVANSDKTMEVFPDIISRYVYRLYECQFFFDKMPHGDGIDLSAPKPVDNVDIKINYKFSTLKFLRFINPDEDVISIDNSLVDLNRIPSNSTNNNFVGPYNTIQSGVPTNNTTSYGTYQNPGAQTPPVGTNQGIDGLKNQTKTNVPNSTSQFGGILSGVTGAIGVSVGFDQIKARVDGAVNGGRFGGRVSAQALLLDKTLQNIRNSSPVRMPSLDGLTQNSVTSRVDRIKQQPMQGARSLEDIVNSKTGKLKF